MVLCKIFTTIENTQIFNDAIELQLLSHDILKKIKHHKLWLNKAHKWANNREKKTKSLVKIASVAIFQWQSG